MKSESKENESPHNNLNVKKRFNYKDVLEDKIKLIVLLKKCSVAVFRQIWTELKDKSLGIKKHILN